MQDGLYPAMVHSLGKASAAIKRLIEGHKLTDEQWETYADAIHPLLDNLLWLNKTVNVEYAFEEGLPHDIINYEQLLVQYHQPLEELVGYLLARQEMFGDLYKYETQFLTEVLDGITYHSNIIAGLVSR